MKRDKPLLQAFVSLLLAQTAVVVDAQQPIPGYSVTSARRCSGGDKIGELSTDINYCARICSESRNCLGFNFLPLDGSCIARSVGCDLVGDSAITFYQKEAPAPPPAPEQVSRDGFDEIAMQKCSGGDKIGELKSSLDDCLDECRRARNCYGVNFAKQANLCVTKSIGCDVEGDQAIVLFRKRVNDIPKSAPIQTRPPQDIQRPTPAPAPAPQQAPNWNQQFSGSQSNSEVGFTEILSMRCTGGSSVTELLYDLEECKAACRKSPDCFGINYIPSDSICVARGIGCELKEHSKASFYRKDSVGQASAPQWNPEPATEPPAPQWNPEPVTVPQRNPEPSTEAPERQTKPFERASLRSLFDVTDKSRCVEGSSSSVGDLSNSLDDCLANCYSEPSCYGVNYVTKSGLCIGRTAGCVFESDESGQFFRKHSSQAPPSPAEISPAPTRAPSPVPVPAPAPVAPPVPPPVAQPAPSPSQVSSFSITYKEMTKSRCAGGSSLLVGTPGNSLQDCKRDCDADHYCYGINWNAGVGLCVARTFGCDMSTHPDTVFLVKEIIQQPVEAPQTTEAPPPVVATDEVVMYLEKVNMRCAGGDKSKIGETQRDIDRCRQICNANVDCYGINWIQSEGICNARTNECKLQAGTGVNFYVKEGVSEETERPVPVWNPPPPPPQEPEWNPPTPEPQPVWNPPPLPPPTPAPQPVWNPSVPVWGPSPQPVAPEPQVPVWNPSPPEWLPPAPAPSPSDQFELDSFPGYSKMTSMRCAGDDSTKIGETQSILDRCIELCNWNDNCYGVNYIVADRTCNAQSKACNIHGGDSSANFFIKDHDLMYPESVPTAPALPPFTITDDPFRVITMPPPVPPIVQTSMEAYTESFATVCNGDASTRMGNVQPNLANCTRLCEQQNCFGINFYQDNGTCELRNERCRTLGDTWGVIFFLNENYQEQVEIVTAPPVVQPSTTVRKQVDLSRFVTNQKSVCAGGTSLGNVENDLQICISTCLTDPSCYGVNWVEGSSLCVAKSYGCSLDQHESAVFYEHLNFRAPQVTSAPVMPPAVVTAEVPSAIWNTAGFTANDQVRCSTYGDDQPDARYSDRDQCSRACVSLVNCYGFNWFQVTKVCILALSSCTEEFDPEVIYYKRDSKSSAPQPNPPPPPAPVTWAPPPSPPGKRVIVSLS